MTKTLIVVCQHGNELFGLDVKKALETQVDFLVAHPIAVKKQVRFIESDLNRSFPGNSDGTYEEQLAHELIPKLNEYDTIIDLHSTTGSTELFGIITKPNVEKITLAQKLQLNKVVLMSEKFAKNKALIDHVDNGISLEIGPHADTKCSEDAITAITHYLQNDKPNKQMQKFEVFQILQGEGKLTVGNFTQIKKGDIIGITPTQKPIIAQEDFYPVLAGEEAYDGILCLQAKLIE